MNKIDNISVSGHLEIYKIYDDGTEEKFFSEANTITSGLGSGLAVFYAGSGATDITNFQIRYFQLGVEGDTKLTSYGVSETLLASALGQEGQPEHYQSDAGSNIPLVFHELMDWDGDLKLDSDSNEDWYFVEIPDNAIKRVDLNSVTYILYVDKNSCNNIGVAINEVGLFMQNPLGATPRRSNLVAYRPFNDLTKTSDFALVFKWTLTF